ncbi:MAG: hypothetical protein PVI99_03115 [Anaerolineales bacterium]|jgi:hypothetical protein
MTIPAFLLGSVIAAFIGALFHFIRGGALGRLVLFLVVSEISFWFGHFVADIIGFTFLSLGAIRLGMAALVTLVALIATEWLSAVDTGERT